MKRHTSEPVFFTATRAVIINESYIIIHPTRASGPREKKHRGERIAVRATKQRIKNGVRYIEGTNRLTGQDIAASLAAGTGAGAFWYPQSNT